MKQKMCFAVYFGNRGFFPEKLIADARKELSQALDRNGFNYLMLEESATKFGAVETAEEGKKFAAFLRSHAGEIDGVILSLPNFGDENGAIEALKDCGVPILIQAYPDEIGAMDFANRRDAFCGKFSIMDVFYQRKLPFTIFKPHTVHPASVTFDDQIRKFAGVCRVVKGMKRFNVGAIGARTTAFKTIRFDELALQKYDINTESLDLLDISMRIRSIDASSSALKERKERFINYTNCGSVPAGKLELIAKLSLVLDDVIAEYDLDCLALRCWIELEKEFGFSPCVVLSELNNRGFAAACELDVGNAISMRALSLASEKPATCLDWNNNYGDDENKCILFHCGPVPQAMMTQKGEVIDHPMFAKSFGEGCGWGCNVGRIRNMEMTYASAKTEDGKIIYYLDEGRFTGEVIEEGFFGCAGVAQINDLQNKLYVIGKNGYRHHVSVTEGHVAEIVQEAFTSYLNYDLKSLK